MAGKQLRRADSLFDTAAFQRAVIEYMDRQRIDRTVLAHRCGVHHFTMSEFIERRGIPSFGVALLLADECDLSLDDYRRKGQ